MKNKKCITNKRTNNKTDNKINKGTYYEWLDLKQENISC